MTPVVRSLPGHLARTLLVVVASCTGAGEDESIPSWADTLADGPAPASVRADLEEPFELALGATAVIGPEQLTIAFRRLSEESRCPSDVQCPTAGNAAAELAVEAADGAAATLTLNTDRPPTEASVHGHLVRLLGLEPSPESAAALADTSDYVATLSVAEAEGR